MDGLKTKKIPQNELDLTEIDLSRKKQSYGKHINVDVFSHNTVFYFVFFCV